MKSSAHAAESAEEMLVKSIRGYDGYQLPDARSATDNHLRDYLTDSLNNINQEITRLEPRLSQYDNHGLLETFHRLVASIAITMQSLKHPIYHNSSFFKQPNLNSDFLAQIYDFDLQMVEKVGIFRDEIEILNQANEACEVEDMLNHLFDLIDGVNQNMSEREFLILADER